MDATDSVSGGWALFAVALVAAMTTTAWRALKSRCTMLAKDFAQQKQDGSLRSNLRLFEQKRSGRIAGIFAI